MPAVDLLTRALAAEGYQPMTRAPGGVLPEGFAWLAGKEHWGSIAAVGLVRADGLRPDALAARAAAFHQLLAALRPMAGTLTIQPPVGAAADIKLAAFGVVVFVHEGGAEPEAVAAAQRLRHGSAREALTLAWTVDAPLGKVHAHKGLPLSVPPGKKVLEQALRER